MMMVGSQGLMSDQSSAIAVKANETGNTGKVKKQGARLSTLSIRRKILKLCASRADLLFPEYRNLARTSLKLYFEVHILC